MKTKLTSKRNKIIKLFEKLGERYEKKNLAVVNIYQNNYVHAFYRLIKNPDKVVHVQGYPGDSSEKKIKVWARVLDYEKMMLIRSAEGVSVGSEHEATTELFPNFKYGVNISYKTKILEKMLEQNIPEFYLKNC